MLIDRAKRLSRLALDALAEVTWAERQAPEKPNPDLDESAALRGVYGPEERALAMDRARLWARHVPTPDPGADHDYPLFGD
jgi:hypothetical protein